MCNHIRQDLGCGHVRFFVHVFCQQFQETCHKCSLHVIHREDWSRTTCGKDCTDHCKFTRSSPLIVQRKLLPRRHYSLARQSAIRARQQHTLAVSSGLVAKNAIFRHSSRSPLAREVRLEQLLAAAEKAKEVVAH